MNLQELLKAKNLDFEVYMLPTYSVINGKNEEVPDNKSVVRADTHKPICGVGGAYEAKSYASILEPFDTLIGQAQIEPIAAFSVAGGARAHIRFRVPGRKITVGELELNQEFVVTTSHDGTSYWTLTLHAKDPQGRVYPIGEVGSKRIKHTSGIHARVSALSDLFESLIDGWHQFDVRAQAALNVQISDLDAKQLIARVFPSKEEERAAKIAAAIIERWHKSLFPTHRKSVFGLYIAACQHAQDNRRARMTKQRIRNNDQVSDIKAVANMVDKKLFAVWATVTEMVD